MNGLVASLAVFLCLGLTACVPTRHATVPEAGGSALKDLNRSLGERGGYVEFITGERMAGSAFSIDTDSVRWIGPDASPRAAATDEVRSVAVVEDSRSRLIVPPRAVFTAALVTGVLAAATLASYAFSDGTETAQRAGALVGVPLVLLGSLATGTAFLGMDEKGGGPWEVFVLNGKP